MAGIGDGGIGDSGILDDYLSEIADVPSDNADTSVEDDNNEEVQAKQPELAGDTVQADSEAVDETQPQDRQSNQRAKPEPKQKGKDAKGKQPNNQQQQQPNRREQLTPRIGGVYSNSQGDIVDDRGNIIAPRGAAARYQQIAARQKMLIDGANGTIAELQRRLTDTGALDRVIRQRGFSTDEVAQAFDLLSRAKTDILGVAKEIVALAVARGHNVTEVLGNEVGDSLDMRAVRTMLNEQLAPIHNAQRARQEQAQRDATVRRNYEDFVMRNEFADVHGEDIVRVSKRDGVNLQTAYNRLFAWAAKNDFDFSRPLGPQYQARVAQQQRRPTGPNVNTQPRMQRPMPNNASTRPPGAQQVQPQTSADASWTDIIQDAMREGGMLA